MNLKKSYLFIFIFLIGVIIIFILTNHHITQVPEEDIVALKTDDQEPVPALTGIIICIDPGHGTYVQPEEEDTVETKPVFALGTTGAHLTESELNLIVSQKLKKELENLGADVYMTREGDEISMSNKERALFANDLQADLCIKVHADGSDDPSFHGISVLVPKINQYEDTTVIENSAAAAFILLEELVFITNANGLGVVERADLTGLNWSSVPVVLVEMGFMTNPEEDQKLETDTYQNIIVQGMVNGVVRCFAKGI